jgi:dephospho-CoA kinase
MKHTDGCRAIGITGGVGSGKSRVLGYLSEVTECSILTADEEAKKLYVPGSPVFDGLVAILGEDVLDEKGEIIKARVADRIFSDGTILERINALVHPAVKDVILRRMKEEKGAGIREFFFVEAALLLECGYDAILDDIWYVYASEEVRTERLMRTRGYSSEKVRSIFAAQLSSEEYRSRCGEVIDNDSTIEHMKESVDRILKKVRGS